MAVPTGGGLSPAAQSLPAPRPKSPPEYPDLYGKRREMAKVQMLEREIGFLEAELKFVEGLQPASRCCKEVSDSVVANSDPLIHTHRKNRRPCRFWKWLCKIPCLNLLRFCCCCHSECSCHLKRPKCLDCNLFNCCIPCSDCCPRPSCPTCSCFQPCCCRNILCCASCNCCKFRCPSCSDSYCCRCKCSLCFKCPRARLCCNCKNPCSDPCCLAF